MKDNPIAADGLSRLVLEEIPFADDANPTSVTDDPANPPPTLNKNASDSNGAKPRKKRQTTRENIERLVREGAQSYPAYLKLVHTGESDFSDFSDDEHGTKGAKGNVRIPNVPKATKCDGDGGAKIDVGAGVNVQDVCDNSVEHEQLNGSRNSGSDTSLNKSSMYDEYCWYKQGGSGSAAYHPIGEFNSATSPEYDNAQNVEVTEATEQEKEEWRADLAKLEEDIMTLRQVLGSKIRESTELKRKLGITPMTEIKGDFKQGLQNIRDSPAYKKTSDSFHTATDKIASTEAYQKTNETFKTVGNKTATMFSSLGAFTSRKIGDARNSNTFKSFEEKMGGAYSNMKQSRSIGNFRNRMTRVRGSKSESNFNDVLNSSASADRLDLSPDTPSGEDNDDVLS